MRPHVNQHHNAQDRSQTAVGPLENSVEPSGSGRVCNCSVILLTSSSPATRAKHGAELGRYRLAGQYSGRAELALAELGETLQHLRTQVRLVDITNMTTIIPAG